MSEPNVSQDLFPALPCYVGPDSGLLAFCHHDRAWEWSHSFSERITYVRRKKPAHEIPIRERHMVYLSPERLIAVGVPAAVVAEGDRLLAERDRLLAERDRLWGEGDSLWAEGARLRARAEGDRLLAEGDSLRDKGDSLRDKGNRLRAEGARLLAERDLLLAERDRLLLPYTKAITALAVSLVPDCRWDGHEIVFEVTT